MTETETIHHVNTSLLSVAESRVIAFLVRLIPSWITPDMLTILGFYSAIGCGISYFFTDISLYLLLVACIMIVGNWLGDSLDGRLAYYRRQQNCEYGVYFDHIIDAFSVLAVCIGITASALTTTLIWLFVALGYILYELHITLKGWGTHTFSISFFLIGPTELRILLLLINFGGLLWATKSIYIYGYTLFYYDVIGLFCFLMLLMLLQVLIISTMRKLKRLS